MDAFMTDLVEVKIDEMTSSLHACVFPVEYADPFEQEVADSDIKIIQVVVNAYDWDNDIGIEPKVGMEIRTQDDTRYLVSRVDRYTGLWKMEARSI